MPTPEQVERKRALRGRFLAALWELEQSDGRRYSKTPDVFMASGDQDLTEEARARVILDLVSDYMIEEFGEGTAEQNYPYWILLTPSGRAEVEQWVDTGRPTQHLPIPYSTVINNTTINGSVQGSTFVSGSHDVTVSNQSDFGSELSQLVEKARELLTQVSLPEEEYEEAGDDLATLAEEAGADQPKMPRVRAALRRVMGWSGKATATGLALELSSVVNQGAQQLLQLAR